MRLDRFLSEMNIGTRSQIKQLIRQKKVSVNGTLASGGDEKIDEFSDCVLVLGQRVVYERFVYYMLNKPKGVVSATKDPKEKTVLSLIPDLCADDVFPVGRLDKDTEGLIILTNDGNLAHRLLSPKKHVDKVYRVTALFPLDEEGIRKLESGVEIGDETPTAEALVSLIGEREFFLTIHEGRYHQIKRMLAAIGNQVTDLKRVRFGKIALDETLKPGESRRLTAQEVALLNES